MKNNVIAENMKIENLSKYACPYDKGIRLNKEKEDFRPSFYRDIDRILYSLAYTRYLDKTQVFTHGNNDHLSRRMTHVQFVSKITRTIGRALNLNEDLIEAASLGHDLGHTPFGHFGESILNKISLENNEGYFNHNIQSIRLLMNIENHGQGLNITLPVLDAIMCHNGEFALGEYYPKNKTKEEFLSEYERSYQDKELLKKLKPMTLEGCVVRISDMIAYLGKDIEDGVRIGLISFDDIPNTIKENLGTTNKEIVNNIIMDIINNSLDKNYIKLSDNIFESIVLLKKFNYEHIYSKAYSIEDRKEIEDIFRSLFNKYLEDLKSNNQESLIFSSYLNNMSNDYRKNSHERIVIDYLAGMTDDYIKKQYNKLRQKM
jgi:dGTPase